jgi:hypothetical protein
MILSSSAPKIARNQLRAAHSIGNKPLNGLQVLSTLDLKKSRQESSRDTSKNGLPYKTIFLFSKFQATAKKNLKPK